MPKQTAAAYGDLIAAERARLAAAKAAVADSVDSVHIEAHRLRDSREIALRLAEHVRHNHFTERIAASMELRSA